MKKNDARQLTLKIFMQWPKKIHTKNLITKKNSCGWKIPLPFSPITFLMVRPLEGLSSHQDIVASLGQFCAEVIT